MRVERAWALVLAAVGVALCALPLFNVLGYEFCLALAVAASLAGAHVGTLRVLRERAERAPSAVTAAAARPGATMVRLWLASTARLWLLLMLPLGAVLVNALRVRNCDLGAGLGWFFMLPMLSAAMGAALGTVVGLVRAWRGVVAPSLCAVAGVVLSVAWGVWRFYAAPPICGYDPFVGYFAGTLYDEEVAITAAFGWARLHQLAVVAVALSLCARHLDATTLTLRRRGSGSLVAVVASLAAAVTLHAERARLGIALDAADIARALGAETRTAHFVLHYSPSGPYAREIDLYAADHELRWSQLERWFGAAPTPPIHAFLFDNAAQKRALMGAGHTFIAKPWRREIYLQHDAWPQHVTAHELAHVFAGPFGDRLFGIARRGLAFNVGLIEGVAVAASWSGGGGGLTPHQIVKVLRDAHAIDDATLGRVMGPRFFGLNAAQAYNLAGSFCRFLADTRGSAKLEALYAAAGAPQSWRAIYGVDFDTLAAEWRAFIDTQAVPAAERAVALERLKRPSVFVKVCAHAQALRKQSAQAAAQAGDRAAALAQWDAVCADDPGDPQNLVDALDAAIAADARAKARELAEKLLARRDIDGVLRGRAESALGDLRLLAGDVDGARLRYDAAAKFPSDESAARLLTVKRLVCNWAPGPSRAQLVPILVSPPAARDAAVDLATLQKLADRDRDLALYHYLLGRQLFGRGRWAEAVEELSVPAREPLPDARFDREATRMIGVALFRLGRIAQARAQFGRLAGDHDANVGARLDAFDWIDRCDFATASGAR